MEHFCRKGRQRRKKASSKKSQKSSYFWVCPITRNTLSWKRRTLSVSITTQHGDRKIQVLVKLQLSDGKVVFDVEDCLIQQTKRIPNHLWPSQSRRGREGEKKEKKENGSGQTREREGRHDVWGLSLSLSLSLSLFRPFPLSEN